RVFFFSSRGRHTRCYRDWSSDVCSSDLTHEPRGPVIGRDPSFLERLLPIGWHGISEGPFELHQFGPGDMRVATHPPALHPTVPRSKERRVGKECSARWATDE